MYFLIFTILQLFLSVPSLLFTEVVRHTFMLNTAYPGSVQSVSESFRRGKYKSRSRRKSPNSLHVTVSWGVCPALLGFCFHGSQRLRSLSYRLWADGRSQQPSCCCPASFLCSWWDNSHFIPHQHLATVSAQTGQNRNRKRENILVHYVGKES